MKLSDIPPQTRGKMSEDRWVEVVLEEALPLVGTIPVAQIEALINEKLRRTIVDYETPPWPLCGV